MTKRQTMTLQEAQEFAQFTAIMDRVDFEAGEGKVIVFNNAVIIMKQSSDHPDSMEMQIIGNQYRRVDIDISDMGQDIDWSKYL